MTTNTTYELLGIAHLCCRFASPRHALDLDLSVLCGPDLVAVDDDRRLRRDRDREDGVPRSDGRRALRRTDLALERRIVLQQDRVHVQREVAWGKITSAEEPC